MQESVAKYQDKTIAVLMGGLSSEREISLRSGNNIHQALTNLGLTAVKIDVQRDIAQVLSHSKIDLAFIALHGKYGEDGCIQGLLEIMNIPYTGSGVTASAISMNKSLTKKILKQANIPVPDNVDIDIQNLRASIDSIEAKLGFPVIIKALGEGSSVGIELINSRQALESTLPSFMKKFPDAFAEQYIKGKEMTIGVLGTPSRQEVFPILELRPKNAFYDFEAKYTKDMTEFVIPADIPSGLTTRLQDLAQQGYRALGLSGVARLDLMLDAQEQPFFLEANTIPGFTETSDIPAMARAQNMSYEELMLKILETVEYRQ